MNNSYDLYSEINIDNLESIMHDIINNYCQDKGITDKSEIDESYWNRILSYFYDIIFKNCNFIKDSKSKNLYNRDNVLTIYNIYRNICFDYRQNIYLLHFSNMIGIDRQTLYNWVNEYNFDIVSKIHGDNELSLQSKLNRKGLNPVGTIAALNHYQKWSGDREQVPKNIQINISSDALPNLQQKTSSLLNKPGK